MAPTTRVAVAVPVMLLVELSLLIVASVVVLDVVGFVLIVACDSVRVLVVVDVVGCGCAIVVLVVVFVGVVVDGNLVIDTVVDEIVGCGVGLDVGRHVLELHRHSEGPDEQFCWNNVKSSCLELNLSAHEAIGIVGRLLQLAGNP